MITDLSKYRLNDKGELDKFSSIDPLRFILFQRDVFNMLDGILPGERINVIDVCKPASFEVFIKVVCLYIIMHRYDDFDKSQIEFSDDYTQIYRRPGIQIDIDDWDDFFSKK